MALIIDVCRIKKYRTRPKRDALHLEMFINKIQAEKDNVAVVTMLRNKSSQRRLEGASEEAEGTNS